MKFYIEGTRRGLGKFWIERHECVGSMKDCDVFINNKHDGFLQVHRLYQAADMGKRIINIGSNSPDTTKRRKHVYSVEKAALDAANEQLYYAGVNTTIVRFGYFDTPRVESVKEKKMSLEYVESVILWVLDQPHRVKDLTVTP